jgi:hypothetical protein
MIQEREVEQVFQAWNGSGAEIFEQTLMQQRMKLPNQNSSDESYKASKIDGD